MQATTNFLVPPLCSDLVRQSGFAMLESAYAAVLEDVMGFLCVERSAVGGKVQPNGSANIMMLPPESGKGMTQNIDTSLGKLI